MPASDRPLTGAAGAANATEGAVVTKIEERLRKDLPRLAVVLADTESVTQPHDLSVGGSPEARAPMARSNRGRHRVAMFSAAVALLVSVVIVGVVALAQTGGEERRTQTQPAVGETRAVS